MPFWDLCTQNPINYLLFNIQFYHDLILKTSEKLVQWAVAIHGLVCEIELIRPEGFLPKWFTWCVVLKYRNQKWCRTKDDQLINDWDSSLVDLGVTNLNHQFYCIQCLIISSFV